eukprot:9344582-Heterocapsa_arctica.AAC.1
MFFQRRVFNFKVQTSLDVAAKTTKLAIEIASGRLAIVAIISMFLQRREFSFKVQTSSDMAPETTKLAREIASGRLAI